MDDVAIFSVLLFLSAFFSSSETAFFSLTNAQVRLISTRDSARSAQLVARLKAKPQELLITILIGNNIVNLFTASYATVVATEYFGSHALGIATGATTLIILIGGEIIPKSLAYTYKDKIARFAAIPLFLLQLVFTPLIYVLTWINSLMTRLIGGRSTDEYVTEEEVRAMSRMGVESGRIDYRAHEMIENIFQFDDKEVGKIMTPWYRVVTLSGTVPVEQIAHSVSHEGYSRYPVHDGKSSDNIIGYIHVNELMKVLNSDERDRPVADFISPVKFVPSDYNVERAFRAMVRKRTHLFMVCDKDDHEELIGLVTLEDIVEEIVGEIVDENDDWEKELHNRR